MRYAVFFHQAALAVLTAAVANNPDFIRSMITTTQQGNGSTGYQVRLFNRIANNVDGFERVNVNVGPYDLENFANGSLTRSANFIDIILAAFTKSELYLNPMSRIVLPAATASDMLPGDRADALASSIVTFGELFGGALASVVHSPLHDT